MTYKNIFLLTALSIVLCFSCKDSAIDANKTKSLSVQIDSVFTPTINGIKQAIKVQTDDSNKPVLLFLTGGPGSSSMDNSDSFTEILKNEFTIVEWDQRNVGKTLELNSSPTELSIDLMYDDTYEVIMFIIKKEENTFTGQLLGKCSRI